MLGIGLVHKFIGEVMRHQRVHLALFHEVNMPHQVGYLPFVVCYQMLNFARYSVREHFTFGWHFW